MYFESAGYERPCETAPNASERGQMEIASGIFPSFLTAKALDFTLPCHFELGAVDAASVEKAAQNYKCADLEFAR